ncbi:argininosuccinate lyase [Gloeobacter kilaueensis]|uniref:Argininosuccinate lyase n=1 Tax=Gloeobacter kilaueensis (strain ATCC BAA-2537 / CCAP 1431/1 / ULC 316 / JS1) TaxID=1183438 RepID=U5QFH7_GLOK1|nr:argininosuccinate lyase [Gloeobacter kilaueensis]AGY57696.1 argininosuccinate lyase [Gloeobacter kilaueensis JS1]
MTTTPWSSRFEEGLHPAIAAFNASIGFDIELIEYDLTGSVAHAQMLAHTGILSAAEAEAIVTGLEQIRSEWRSGQFLPAIDQEDVHFAVERRLVAIVGEVGKKLHTARSRNDQVNTDLRLWQRARIDAIAERLLDFERVLLDLAKAHVETLIPGYTHLQRAQPVSLAHHLLAYVEMAERDRSRLEEVRARTNICPLGSGALAGTVLPIDRHYTARLLGFAGVSENSLDAVSDRDFAVEFLAALSLIAVHLSRLAEEMVLWASQEFRFVLLTDRCATGSSLMPQKKNPDVPELVRGKSGRVFGHLLAMLTTLKGLPLAYNKDLQEDKEALFDAARTIEASVEAMTILMREGIDFQSDRLSAAVGEDFSNATDAADYLVRRGVPFRSAYGIIGAVVKHCLGAGLLLRELPIDEWQRFHPAFEADLYAAIAPETVVAARNSYGGTGFEQVRAALARAEARLQAAVASK